MFTEGTELGLFKNLKRKRKTRQDGPHARRATQRRCHFEKMEPRQLLDADPVVAGITYLEDDLGQDITPDYFEVTFEGGADTTQLTQFVINGDQDLSGGLSQGDIFFDIDDSQPGAGQFHNFSFDEGGSRGLLASDVLGVEVSDDGLQLTVNVQNFEEGDVLAFRIDVDEVESLRNDRIASGVEFEGTFFDTTFVDENYTFVDADVSIQTTIDTGQSQTQTEGVFFDEFDNLLAEGEDLSVSTLDLVRDNEEGNADRTAAAVDVFDLVPKPIEISGTVYHDEDLDCVHDGTEEGIGGVFITLERFNDSTGEYEAVAATQTDGRGDYSFGEELGLTPGVYRLIQTQPDGYLDVGASAGEVDGVSQGSVLDDAGGNQNIIGEIDIPLGGTVAENYDFKEVLPASLEGNVWHDENNDGVFDPNEEGIANVLIQVTRVGAKDGVTNDPFAGTEPIFVRTDANGHYEVTALPPGIYTITEINNYPPGSNPLIDFIDGKDSIGTINGAEVGSQVNDQFTMVELCPGEHGVEYNFGEIQAASVSGYVSVQTPGVSKLDPTDPGFEGISGVEIQLFDDNGELVASTFTDEQGFYEFGDLDPGTYSLVEVQPDGFLDGADVLGNVDGQDVGAALTNDRFTNIELNSGDEGVRYDFCEHPPAQLKGTVWFDVNNDGIQQANEQGIAGVRIQLFDDQGNLVAEQITDENGDYCFEDLEAGNYKIRQIQPTDFVDGQESLGNVDGQSVGEHANNDEFCDVVIGAGQTGVDYDFGEIRLASISGFVHLDHNGDCVFDASEGDEPLNGVVIQLLNPAGEVIGETLTDASGNYTFDNLLPGQYSIRQVQPDGTFTLNEHAGSGGGETAENIITEINVVSGQNLVNYDFCETPAAEIHGRVFEDGPAFQTEDGTLPEGFRDQRDGIFDPSVDTPIEGVRIELWYYIDPATNEINPRPVTLGEVLGEFYPHLGDDPNAPVFVETGADGQYWFQGLQAGNYIAVESQPDGFFDANDTPGSTTGFTVNSESEAATQSILLTTFTGEQILDSVVNIRVDAGGVSEFNNFSEVRALTLPSTPPPPPTPDTPQFDNPFVPQSTPRIPNPTPPSAPLAPGFGLAGAQAANVTTLVGGGRGAAIDALPPVVEDAFTWHLSVVNAGEPRGGDSDASQPTWLQASYLSQNDWNRFDMEAGEWTFTTQQADGTFEINSEESFFGMIAGTPLSGDFDGDGKDEVVIYKDGYWMIDLNGNGQWDIDDLMARLGDHHDRPVVGDWDGDGKDDIGIYGPEWEGDAEAIDVEPGLPDPDNDPLTRPKNIPPQMFDAAEGARAMRLSSFGSSRIDVIDHVFGYGEENDVPVTGDWNGDSIRSIGMFSDGRWQIDLNGDGRFDYDDAEFTFGRAGDIPLVGDFNGDGIEEVAVYRNGTWIIDSNGNQQRDAADQVFEMGGRGDLPVVGDWDGDGIDEPALYRSGGQQATNPSTLQ